MSQYSRYLTERTNTNIIERDFGFVTYRFVPEGVYIEDVFIEKHFRRLNKASEFGDEVAEIARQLGHKMMFGSVCLDAKEATASMKFLLSYGMELHNLSGNMIYLKKVIGV